jgi:hypothetical protein
LDGSYIKDRYTKLAHTLSLESGACDVELNDIISEFIICDELVMWG